ncbi:PRC-barrel domain-containing protein [Lyngbya confervoides]|uniref:PRC-barrel domain-containing protein n=1 Tax=Lyngbya confervoides BDU141951 TaxID=1574623 RepID=A0ABD4T259_9CYAN|nr:PRC-barrel domain-containing protein [Lyngbya confervoides]MCM1982513.1 PRC-barrel domain-containing protein [Lyngbya confervoides BDU141951]
MPESNLKSSNLHHRLVLDRQTSEKVGHLTQLLLDPPAQKIVGFYCGGGLFGGARQAFHWDQIHSIGNDSILVSGPQWDLDWKGSSPIKAPIGHELWTDSGNQIGQLVDLVLEPATGAVVHYIFACKGWQGVMEGTYRIPPIVVSNIGSKRIIVLEAMLGHMEQETEGLGHRAEQIAEFLRADYEQTREDLAALRESAQSAVDKVKSVLPMPSSPEHADHESDHSQS